MAAPQLSRRAFLGVVLGTATLSAGCSGVIDRATRPDLPKSLHPPGGAERNPIAHLLNRAAFGPRPGQVAEVEKMGRERWIDQQLDYTSIDDTAIKWRVRRYDTLSWKPQDLLSFSDEDDQAYVAGELTRMTLLRAVISERQLYEVMVNFWSNHFSIYHYKNNKVVFLKTIDDREVIRPHALGRFRDLLKKSAHSPAMLEYLDNTVNEKSHPNENYAREIMELHTLGVNGGYTEDDVREVARCFTGWTISGRGEFDYKDDIHDDGEKIVLGEVIPSGGGKKDGDRVLEILADHPSTARFVCTKLVRNFVADEPPQSIIDACVETWQATDGDIKKIVRTLLMHPEFDDAPPKFKRPFEFMVSLFRALNADYNGSLAMVNKLEAFGNRPFTWPMPDGFPDVAPAWTSNILNNWNLAIDAVQEKLDGVRIKVWEIADVADVDGKGDADKMLAFFGRLCLKRDLNVQETMQLRTFLFDDKTRLDLSRDDDRKQMDLSLGLLLASPAFQWR